MPEIIAFIFILRGIKKLAIQKGLKPITWKIYTVIFWFIFEFTGISLGMFLFNNRDLVSLELLGLISGFGGYLLVRSILQKRPDADTDDDINSISVDDLKP
ncbi:MAG: hypothetical protein RIS73_243 [Bacteroidota bacterium]|jgi:hypothetical protein